MPVGFVTDRYGTVGFVLHFEDVTKVRRWRDGIQKGASELFDCSQFSKRTKFDRIQTRAESKSSCLLYCYAFILKDNDLNLIMNNSDDNKTIITNNDGIVIMSSPPHVSKSLEKDDTPGENTASSTPATSNSSTPYLGPSSPPHEPVGFTLKLNEAIISSVDNEQQEDSHDAHIAEASSSNIYSSSWKSADIALPASQKSLRTYNPIRAIVDPIMAHSIKCGKKRGDGKDQISLAVSRFA